jgi:crotonobetainyl-CoA:carnitine CoA-transferase CaiB-like acyl-CoA transferase
VPHSTEALTVLLSPAMSQLPYQGIRIIEQSTTLTGRLAGLLFADQGAEVFVERAAGGPPGEQMAIWTGRRRPCRKEAWPTPPAAPC